jgi:thymidylate synthase
MNQLDIDYQNLLKDILENGVKKETRNGKVLSVFGRQIRHSFKDGKFPILTSKRIHFHSIIVELRWFLQGRVDLRYLLENNCHIWNGDAYQNYLKKYEKDKSPGIVHYTDPLQYRPYTQEEFIDHIKSDDEFANTFGNFGPIYGKQWRSWENQDGCIENGDLVPNTSIDQITNLINDLKTNPDSRRMMVNAYNPGELDQMVLPPCHYGFQVWTRELSLDERYDLMPSITGHSKGNIEQRKKINNFEGNVEGVSYHEEWLNSFNIPKRAISLMYNARSQDVPLGTPFNISSYGLLLEIIAREVNMIPDELIANLGDCHIYENQIEYIKDQLERTPFELPELKISKSLEEKLGKIPFDESLSQMSPEDFTLENYVYHPSIKIPLSN